jgi:hypothetical protein
MRSQTLAVPGQAPFTFAARRRAHIVAAVGLTALCAALSTAGPAHAAVAVKLVNAKGATRLADGSIGLARLTGTVHSWSTPVKHNTANARRVVKGLVLAITTGADDLRGGPPPEGAAKLIISLTSGAFVVFSNINASQKWNNNSVHKIYLLSLHSLPAKTKLREISKLEIVTSFEGGLFGDNWDIADVELVATVP